MNIALGNLKLSDIIKSEYLDMVESFFKDNGFKNESICDNVKNAEGNYHIYDMPKRLDICGENKAKEFVSFIQKNNLADKFSVRVAVCILPMVKAL